MAPETSRKPPSTYFTSSYSESISYKSLFILKSDGPVVLENLQFILLRCTLLELPKLLFPPAGCRVALELGGSKPLTIVLEKALGLVLEAADVFLVEDSLAVAHPLGDANSAL